MALQPAARRFLQPALLLDLRVFRTRAPPGPGLSVSWSLPRSAAPAAAPHAVVGHQFAQNALAQAAVGDAQPLATARRARIASRMAQPASTRSARSAPMQGLATRAWKSQPSSFSIMASTFGVVHPQPVDAAAVVAFEAEMHAGQRRHRAGGAEQVEARRRTSHGRAGRGPRSLPACRRRRRPSPRTAAGVTSRPPNRSASETTPTGSEVQETMWLASRGERWPRDVDQRDLGRAAADVEQHDAVGVALDQRAAARHRQPRLGAAVDDLERQPGLAPRRARGTRRHCRPSGRPRWRSAASAPDRAAGAACRRRPSAPRRRGPSPRSPSRPVADSPSPSRTMRENASMTRNWPGRAGHGDQQPAIVGAEIERGEDRADPGNGRAARRLGVRRRRDRLQWPVALRRSPRACFGCWRSRRLAARRRVRKPCGRACACAASCHFGLSCGARLRACPLPDRPSACRPGAAVGGRFPAAGRLEAL